MAAKPDVRAATIAGYVRAARRIAVLTGAGISTPSGIPDFRSPTGLYSIAGDANVFEIEEFAREPGHFYDFARRFYPMLAGAEPNAAHRALAAWEKAGKDVEIATQNIDDLHQRAGSTRVYPVHGTVRTSTCGHCGRSVETAALSGDVEAGRVPRCECGGVFKPDIVFFGELLPEAAWNSSVRAMASADLVLVVGTSLVVHPAAALPGYRRRSAKLVIINRDPTPLDDEADGVWSEDVAAAFRRIGEGI